MKESVDIIKSDVKGRMRKNDQFKTDIKTMKTSIEALKKNIIEPLYEGMRSGMIQNEGSSSNSERENNEIETT